MILDQKHIKLGDRTVISHFTFTPPLIASSYLDGQACFIFPVNTKGDIYRQDGRTTVDKDQAVLLNCGSYVNKWNSENRKDPAQVVILRLFPDILETVLDAKTSSLLKEKTRPEKSSTVVEMDLLMRKYMDSIYFYFDNPDLVNDELVSLKIKELMLLLVSSGTSNPVVELLSDLFSEVRYSLREILDANICEDLSLDELAALSHMSTPTFKRKCRQYLGESPARYIRNKRLEMAKRMLQDTTGSVSDVSYDCGFNDPNHFSKLFHKQFGLTPSEFRRMPQ